MAKNTSGNDQDKILTQKAPGLPPESKIVQNTVVDGKIVPDLDIGVRQ